MLLLLFALHFASIMQSQTLQAKLFHEMIYTLKGINAIEGFRQQYCWGFFCGQHAKFNQFASYACLI